MSIGLNLSGKMQQFSCHRTYKAINILQCKGIKLQKKIEMFSMKPTSNSYKSHIGQELSEGLHFSVDALVTNSVFSLLCS